ncbi:MAG: 3-hydroxyacyl-CoA dehydrogenase NAD-binding domain-containing protein [Pseudomonadota bacterium]
MKTPSSQPKLPGGASDTHSRQGSLPPCQHWQADIDEHGVWRLTLDRAGSSTNVLSSAVLGELDTLLSALVDRSPRAVMFRSAKRGFIAGADITEFERLADADQAYALIRRGQLIMEQIAELPCPTVALINGFALGGGLELALACRYRVMVDEPSATLGLPEVKLGIHPGFGGTVRSIRMLGPVPAMSMMLTGRNVRAREAKRIGLVDQIVPARHLQRAGQRLALSPPPVRRRPIVQTLLDTPFTRGVLVRQLRRQVSREAREAHYPAPYAIIDLWRCHGDASHGTFLEAEARSIAALMCSHTSRHLVRVFGLQDRLKALAPRMAPARHVHVIGAGLMGGDIAAWCAMKGLRVTLQDREAKDLVPAIERAGRLFKRRLREPKAITAAYDRLLPDPDGNGIANADVIIEAIYENLEAKRTLFAKVEATARPDAVLASNTSSIRLERIREILQAPQRLIGLHFFNPVAKLPLVEVIAAPEADRAALDRGCALVKQIGKLPLPCASAPGFVVNRVLMPYLMEAFAAIEEGIELSSIDRAARDFGMPVGPVELADTIGLDVCLLVSGVFAEEFDLDVPERLKRMVAEGKLGRKAGEGFYQWRRGKPLIGPDPEDGKGRELAQRLILPMLNESIRCLREGVIEDPELLDAGIIFGTGFAPFTGGPIHYAQRRGVDTIVAELAALTERHGARFTPDSGWDTLRATP